jgi:hypothetical protein
MSICYCAIFIDYVYYVTQAKELTKSSLLILH